MQRRCLNCDSLCPVVPDHLEPLKFCDDQCRAEFRSLQASTLAEREQRQAQGEYNGSWRKVSQPVIANRNNQSTESEAKEFAKSGDYWIYNRLELFQKQNIQCGTMDTMPPTNGEYVIQPYSVFGNGMAQKATLYDDWDCYFGDTDFWSDILTGTRYKVTYENNQQVLCVEALRDTNVDLHKVNQWINIDKQFELPKLQNSYKNITVTYIGNIIVDIALEKNSMFMYSNSQAIPVEHGASTISPDDYTYTALPNHKHLSGIFYK